VSNPRRECVATAQVRVQSGDGNFVNVNKVPTVRSKAVHLHEIAVILARCHALESATAGRIRRRRLPWHASAVISAAIFCTSFPEIQGQNHGD
jgi:hypothetical protein